MRSMTRSSADTSVPVPLALPVTPCTFFTPTPTPHNLLSTETHRDTHIQPAFCPQTPSTNRSSFFDVKNDTPLLSPHSNHRVTQAIQNGWANSTVRRYSGAIEQFIRFCDAEGVPAHLRFPADEFVLCAFAASSAGVHARSTPRGRLSALKAWHIAHNLEWKGSSRLRYVLDGVHNLAPRDSKHPPRPPINSTMISQLIQNLDLDSPLDIAIAACATTAFWGQCRLGELLPSSLSVLQSTPFPVRSSFMKSTRNPHAFVIRLPRTKTHSHGQEVILVDQCLTIDPITLLKRHLRINNISVDAHLFSYTSPQGSSPLTKSLFLQRCNDIWSRLGYPRTTGHCFRIGGTTELLIAGTPPDVVKATGRWSSDSFLRYWRSLDDIAPQYIRHLHAKKRKHNFR